MRRICWSTALCGGQAATIGSRPSHACFYFGGIPLLPRRRFAGGHVSATSGNHMRTRAEQPHVSLSTSRDPRKATFSRLSPTSALSVIRERNPRAFTTQSDAIALPPDPPSPPRSQPHSHAHPLRSLHPLSSLPVCSRSAAAIASVCVITHAPSRPAYFPAMAFVAAAPLSLRRPTGLVLGAASSPALTGGYPVCPVPSSSVAARPSAAKWSMARVAKVRRPRSLLLDDRGVWREGGSGLYLRWAISHLRGVEVAMCL